MVGLHRILLCDILCAGECDEAGVCGRGGEGGGPPHDGPGRG